MAELAEMNTPVRLKRLLTVLEQEKLDGLLVSNLSNIRWLCGFSGSAGWVVVTPDGMTLITDARYSGQAEQEVEKSGANAAVVIEKARQKEAILTAFQGSQKIGLEAEDISLAQFQAMEADWFDSPKQLVPTSGLLSALRRQKDEGEIDRMERAADIADRALKKVQPLLEEQPTEKEVARALDAEMLDMGADGISFETIVAAGSHSAWAHARPSNRRIQKGELVLIDMGALVDGYHSDMSRTFALDALEEIPAKMYEVVKSAQQAGLDAVKAGSSCAEVDKASRDVIESAGWGAEFNHSTGHGVGLDIHEEPRVTGSSEQILSENDVITVEPGVYVPPHGGVRIEDMVLVTASGCRSFSKSPKNLFSST